MVDQQTFHKIVDEDFFKLKFLLKNKIASFDEIKKEEQQIIEAIKQLMAQIKEMELVLEEEVAQYKRLSKGWEKAYVEKRWHALGNAIKHELDGFALEYQKTKNTYQSCLALYQRLQGLVKILKTMNSDNKQEQQEELKLLEDFKKQKQSAMESI